MEWNSSSGYSNQTIYKTALIFISDGPEQKGHPEILSLAFCCIQHSEFTRGKSNFFDERKTMQIESVFVLKVNIEETCFSGFWEIGKCNISTLIARFRGVIRDIDVSTVLIGNIPIEKTDHAGAVKSASGAVILLKGSRIRPGIQKIGVSFAVTMMYYQRTFNFVVDG